MSEKLSQKERIIKYMKDFGSITHRDAFMDLGMVSFTARMSELRREGYEFVQVEETGKNRYGEKTHYTRYFLAKEN